MSDLSRIISWLLLALLAVVGLCGATLGVALSPTTAPLSQAVTNTLAAASYSEVLSEQTPQGKETAYLTFQAPDRLGGYIESGSKRSYVYVIGGFEYQSVTTSNSASTKQLTFYRQQSQGGATAVDPAQMYLRLYKQGKHEHQSGNTYTFALTQGSQSGTLTYTVSGQYVSEFTAKVPSASIQLVISQVGSAPPVALPAGAKVIGTTSQAG